MDVRLGAAIKHFLARFAEIWGVKGREVFAASKHVATRFSEIWGV